MTDPLLEAFARATSPHGAAVARVRRRTEESLRRARWDRCARRRASLVGSLVAVGAVFVLIAALGAFAGHGPDARRYVADPLSGGIEAHRGRSETPARVVFDQHSTVRWAVRPPRDVLQADRQQRAALLGLGPDAEVRVLDPDLAPSPSGSYVVRAPASSYFGRQTGPWRLFLVLSPRHVAPDRLLRGPSFSPGTAVVAAECLYQPTKEN